MPSNHVAATSVVSYDPRGIDAVLGWQISWATVAGTIGEGRFKSGAALLARQEHEARIWRDLCTQYFATFSKLPLPSEYLAPERPLEFYRKLREPFAAVIAPATK